MKEFVIIVASGEGNRMKSNLPKQLISIAGKPILMHTIEKFFKYSERINIILVMAPTLIEKWRLSCLENDFRIKHQLIEGGETRFQSVKNGLKLIEKNSLVSIHDGVRPLVDTSTIKRVYKKTKESGNAIPTVSVTESLRKTNGRESTPVEREKYCLIQTPQCFQSELILKAYQQSFKQSFTDDATVIESLGIKINLVEGNRENMKITYPEDLKIAEYLLIK